ncbi:MAG: hypothetical protein RBJ76_03880 [Stenomitos frigidus ULC029]
MATTIAVASTVLELWLETRLLPVLQPGAWVLVDHATLHPGGRMAPLVAAAGAQVV